MYGAEDPIAGCCHGTEATNLAGGDGAHAVGMLYAVG